MAARFKEPMKKYHKVAVVVHCSVSAASTSGLYIAIKNNVDVESMLEKVGLPNLAKDKESDQNPGSIATDSAVKNDQTVKERNRTTELAASSGGALALAMLLNKALFPVRVPITLAITPPIGRFLARRNLINKSPVVWTMAARFKELMKKYSKVGLVVHCSVSAASISGLYIAIKNNVDVESMLEKVGLPNLAKDKESDQNPDSIATDSAVKNDQTVKERNRNTELAVSSGGALALAMLLNKALFPVRVPITLAITPPIARFLARRNLINKSV